MHANTIRLSSLFADRASLRAALRQTPQWPYPVGGGLMASTFIAYWANTQFGIQYWWISLLFLIGTALCMWLMFTIQKRYGMNWARDNLDDDRGWAAIPDMQTRWIKKTITGPCPLEQIRQMRSELQEDMRERSNPLSKITIPGYGIIAWLMGFAFTTAYHVPSIERSVGSAIPPALAAAAAVLAAIISLLFFAALDGRWTERRQLLTALKKAESELILDSLPPLDPPKHLRELAKGLPNNVAVTPAPRRPPHQPTRSPSDHLRPRAIHC